MTPYVQEILDCVTDPRIERIVLQKSAQVAWTDGVVNNTIGYFIAHDPSPILVMFPKDSMAERYSKSKFAPMVRDTAALRAVVYENTRKGPSSTVQSKQFKGGHLELVGSNAPDNMSADPIRIIIIEEPDRCAKNAGGEGNSLKLAYERGKTFYNRKILLGGSPTIKGKSEIEREMELSDCRVYEIPCPHCHTLHALDWSMVVWDQHPGRNHPVYGDYVPEHARLKCPHCEGEYNNIEKNRQLKHGRWRATKEFTGTAGFYLNELYSPFPKARIQDVAAKFLEANKELKAGNPELMITFINTSLGQTWEDQGEHADGTALHARCEAYASEVPMGVLLLTAGVDVQTEASHQRLEVGIYGWGEGEESWLIDYQIIHGDPFRPEVWVNLDNCLSRTYSHECGADLSISAVLIDSGDGNITEAVYQWCRSRRARNVYASKGRGGDGIPFLAAPKVMQPSGALLYSLGVDEAKALILSRLQGVKTPGPGYMHFPAKPTIGDEFFAQLTGEQRGWERGKLVWKQRRRRVEVLDVTVMAFAAMRIKRPDWSYLKMQLMAPPDRPIKSPLQRPVRGRMA